jgi:CBS domain-containing protein
MLDQRRSFAMQVREAMTRDVRVANADETVEQAARLMSDLDAGALPVGENNRLVGMITETATSRCAR